MIRVLLADDQTLVRSGFRLMLDREDDIEVVGEAADGQRAVATVSATRPDVVLMDIRMPILDGVRATAQIMSAPDAPKVLVLTTFDVDEYVVEALRAGASGYLLKDVEPTALIQAVRAVAVGDMPLAPSVMSRVVSAYVAHGAPPTDTRLERLSQREIEVLGLLALGLTNAEISARLVVSLPTTKTHVANILTKLDLRDRVQAAIYAHRQGLAS